MDKIIICGSQYGQKKIEWHQKEKDGGKINSKARKEMKMKKYIKKIVNIKIKQKQKKKRKERKGKVGQGKIR